MQKTNSQKKTNSFVQNFKRNMVIIFISAVLILDLVITTGISYYAGRAMNQKISMLMNANTYQQAMNVESYFTDIKDTASLFFSDEMYYGYDATADMPEIEHLQRENVIMERVQSLGVLENFSDFGVIYANNSAVGWMSESMYEMLANDELYDFFSQHITDENTESGWFVTEKNNYDKIYYVKRLNENAVLVESIYSRELESIFNIPNSLPEMDIRLIDDNKNVIYSSNKDEIGKHIEPDVEALAYSGQSVSNKDYIANSVFFKSNEWCIVCTLPESIVTEEISRLKWYAHIFSLFIMAMIAGVGYLALSKASNSVNEIITTLSDKADHDQLTGVLNKASFQTAVETLVKKGSENATAAFVMLDMDNFKIVNDTLGHKTGDEVLAKFSALVKRLYNSECIIGRMGGDEFALFSVKEDIDTETLKKLLSRQLEVLRTEFISEFKEYSESCGLSLSSGAYVAVNKDLTFDGMYKTADEALYCSKNNGKNTYTVV